MDLTPANGDRGTLSLPADFQFNQASLQDYVDCPRRFQLRYLLMQPWPALVAEPPHEFEAHLRRGADFHRLVHQRGLGLDPEILATTIHDPILKRWWQTYLAHPPEDLPEPLRYFELLVAAPLAGHRLLAKFDLLAVTPGERLVIVDWKTMQRRPSRTILAKKLQTRIYRFLAVETGARFNQGQPPHPEQVEMIYWFAEDATTERFPYDTDQYSADRCELSRLIEEITARQEPVWPLTPDVRQCRFCTYRSLCEREISAGSSEEVEDDLEFLDLEMDLEQIAETEF